MPLPAISPSGVSTAYVYGSQTSAGTGYTGLINAVPPSVNPPIIFEPNSDFSSGQLKVIMIITGFPPNWGGAQIWGSVDNTTYGLLGTVYAGGVQGVTTADFPSHTDPDNVDSLEVNVMESGQQIISGSTLDADLGLTLAYVSGATPSTFELVGYSNATLDSLNNYDLDTHLRRGMFGSTIGDHPLGSNFGLVNGNIFSQIYPSNLIGHTVYFKFLSFNAVGGNLQSLSSAVVYPYTLIGNGLGPIGPGSVSCSVIAVLAGSACCVDLGSLGECNTGICDLGFLGDGAAGVCIDLGVIGT